MKQVAIIGTLVLNGVLTYQCSKWAFPVFIFLVLYGLSESILYGLSESIRNQKR
jgi:hypothetical protein